MSVWLAVLVFIGVAAELIDTFEIFSKWSPFADAQRRMLISKSGLSLLVAALALEVIAAIGSHNANENIIGILNHELNKTVEQATNLEHLTAKLGLSNEALQKQVGVQSLLLNKTGGALSTLSKQSFSFQRAIRTQEASNNADLASLKNDAMKLVEARKEILADAGKSADAAAAATKAQSDMTTALNAVQTMRERMQEIITPRQIDDTHYVALVAALKKHPGTQIEFALTRDVDSMDLLVRITDAVKEGDWKIQPYSGGGFGLNLSSRPDLPQIGEVTGRGVQVAISQTDIPKLVEPANALLLALHDAGIATNASVIADKTADGKANPQAVKAGIIHVIVGTKP